MQVNFMKVKENAVAPAYQTTGAAAMDLVAADTVQVEVGVHVKVGTGIAVEIPPGYVGLVFPRSGNAANFGITLSNAVGVIDSDFRGEIQVLLYNAGYDIFQVNAGDRIAQLMIVPFPAVEFAEQTALSDTTRSDGGLGSTGA
jgi:dUTP pyrophosphatase